MAEASNTTATTTTKKRSRTTYVNLAEFSRQSKTALTNASDPDILPLLKKRGYTEAQIADKLAKIELLGTLDEKQKKEYGEQYDATEAYTKAEDTLHEDYMDHIELARLVFKNDVAAKTAMGLSGDRKQSASGYSSQGLLFYNNALKNDDYKAGLATKGITEAELLAQQAAFTALDALASKQEKETGEAQRATKERDALHDELAAWMGEFKATAIIALRKYPQYREKLGYVEE